MPLLSTHLTRLLMVRIMELGAKQGSGINSVKYRVHHYEKTADSTIGRIYFDPA